MRIAQEEVFGPVLVVIPFDDVDDAVRITNESELGLAGAVFADDDRQALEVARRLRTGHVGINGLGMDWVFPFGGFKQSGLGCRWVSKASSCTASCSASGSPRIPARERKPALSARRGERASRRPAGPIPSSLLT